MGTLGDSLLSSNVATILTTGGEPRLEAWRLRNGRSVWSADLGPESVNTFASNGAALFALRSVPLPAIDGSPSRNTATRIDTVSLVDGKIVSDLDLGTDVSQYFPTHLAVMGSEFVVGAWVNPGSVFAFDRVSGAVRWQRTGFLQFGVADTVIVHDEFPGMVVALDGSTGVERWRFRGKAVTPSTNNTVVVSDFDPYKPGEGTTTTVDLATGKARWSRSHEPLRFGGTTRGISVLASPGCLATSAD